MKNRFKQIIAVILCGIFVLSCALTAMAGGNGMGHDSTIGPTKPESGNNTGASIEPWSDYEQGFRCYIVDSSGQLVSDVRDYWFTDISGVNTYAPGSASGACQLRVKGQTASYSKHYIDEMDLGYTFNPRGEEACTENLPTLCWHSSSHRCNGNKGFNLYFKWPPQEIKERFHTIITNEGIAEEISGAKWLVYNQWPDYYDNFYELGYSLVVEHVFAVDLSINHSQFSGQKFYGSVYEWGLFCKQFGNNITGNICLSYNYTNTYIPNSILLEFLTNTEPGGITDTTNMQVPDFNASVSNVLTGDQLVNYAYGTFVFHEEFKPPVPGPIPEPTDQDIELKNQGTANSYDIPIDIGTLTDIDFYFGNRGTDGKYDIGEDMGIPTTEWFTDVIYAQDRCISYTYDKEEYEKTVNVNFDITYNYQVTIKDSCPDPDKNGNCPHGGHSHQETRTGRLSTSPLSVTRKAKYYFTSDYAVYGLKNVEIINEAGVASYSQNMTDLTEDKITFKCSGKENPNEILGTIADYHVDFSEVQSVTYSHTFGSKAEAESWYNSERVQWAEENVGYPKVKNDFVEIDGFTYMDEKEVSRAESTFEQMDTSGIISDTYAPQPKDPTKDYKITNQEQDVYINAEVLNGKYYSTANVHYNRLAATYKDHPYYLTFTWTATDSDKSHIITDGTAGGLGRFPGVSMVANIDLVNGVSTNYRAQEPIRVITPVISPTTLRYDEDKKAGEKTQEKVSSSFVGDTTATTDEKLIHGTELIKEVDAL